MSLLATPRLHLRMLTPEIYRNAYATMTDEELIGFLALPDAAALAVEKEKFAQGLATHNKSFVNFILLEKDSDILIGHCGFHIWYTEHQRAEIGYDIVDEVYKRKGYMSEAMDAIIAYGFNTMGLHRIEAFVGPENIPSRKLMAHFGFMQEGHLRAHYRKNGRVEDSLVFSLLQPEYNARKKPA